MEQVCCCVCGKEIKKDNATPVIDSVGRQLFICSDCGEY